MHLIRLIRIVFIRIDSVLFPCVNWLKFETTVTREHWYTQPPPTPTPFCFPLSQVSVMFDFTSTNKFLATFSETVNYT